MRIKAVLFDVDGVVTPLDLPIINFQETCKHFRIRVRSYSELMSKVIGLKVVESIPKFFPEAVGITDEFVEYFDENQIKNFKRFSNLLPHVKHVFNFIRKRKLKIGIVTTKPRSSSTAILKGYGLHFDAMVAGDDIKERKPSPEPILRVCKILGVEPRDCIMIGDHHFDMMSAKSAGCTGVGVLTGWDNERNLRKAGATNTLKNLGGLISLLKR